MRIDIDDKLVITSDSRNYILSKKGINKTGKNIGKEEIKNIGYCSSIEDLFKALLTRRVRGLVLLQVLKSLALSLRSLKRKLKHWQRGYNITL